ncbi:MAG: dihydroorotase [Flavobacteriales bacterium]|nr:dihydroorotase [Flavobacteriales bacterium]
MEILIKSTKIVDLNSPFHNKKMDILLKDGVIKKIEKSIKPSAKCIVYDKKNQHLSPGWFDMKANFRDPGFEHKEDLESGNRCAAKGGFTAVACMPSTNPPIHTKSQVEYIKNKTASMIVQVYPVGALSDELKGKDISEMYDMHKSGAIAFSDDKLPIKESGLMIRSLQYVQGFGGLIISYPDDTSISNGGKMNESMASTSLGLKGIPSIAEEVMIERDLALIEYTQGRMHFSTISTAKSVALIKAAKKKGLKVTAEVSINNLTFDDSSIESFDSNYKVVPPLRGKKDITALLKGIKEGTIDTICSDHCPEDVEEKDKDFQDAAPGMIGLETSYPLINKALSDKTDLAEIVRIMATNPREVLGIEVPTIDINQKAELTLFDPKLKWTYAKDGIVSKSKNHPLVNSEMIGKPIAIFNRNKHTDCN